MLRFTRPLLLQAGRTAATLATALLLASGCTGRAPLSPTQQSAPAVAPPGSLPDLPAPSQLKPRQTSTLVNVVDGNQFDAQHVQLVSPDPGSNAAAFTPNWSPTDSGVSGLAYGVYEFVPDLANDQPVLHLAWQIMPPDGTVWVALGNFPGDRWEWHRWQLGHDIPVDFGARHVGPGGRVKVAVAVTGTGMYRLGRLRIGANQPPVPEITTEHFNQPAPCQLTVSAESSTDPDGVITAYDFDLDGDGVYEELGSAQGNSSRLIPTDGSFNGKLRVHDDDGATAELTFDYDTGYRKLWTPFDTYGSASFSDVCNAPGGGYYACGGARTVGQGEWHMLVVRFSPDGTAMWARTLSSANADTAYAIAPAPGGDVYIAGTFNLDQNKHDLLLARYGSGGTLVWQRRWGGGEVGADYGLASDNVNNRVYVTTTLNQMFTGEDAALLRFEADGTWTWSRFWGGVEQEFGTGVGVASDGSVYWSCREIVGSTYGGAVHHLTAAGVTLAKQEYSQTGLYIQPWSMALRSDGVLALLGGVQDSADNSSGPCCVSLDSGLNLRWAEWFSNESQQGGETFYRGAFAQDGRLWLTGYTKSGGGFQALLSWISDAGDNYAHQQVGPAALNVDLYGLDVRADGSLVLAGDAWQAGVSSFSYVQRGDTPMQLTFTTPAQDAYADFIVPAAGSGTDAAIQSVPGPTVGAVVFKYYEPLL